MGGVTAISITKVAGKRKNANTCCQIVVIQLLMTNSAYIVWNVAAGRRKHQVDRHRQKGQFVLQNALIPVKEMVLVMEETKRMKSAGLIFMGIKNISAEPA